MVMDRSTKCHNKSLTTRVWLVGQRLPVLTLLSNGFLSAWFRFPEAVEEEEKLAWHEQFQGFPLQLTPAVSIIKNVMVVRSLNGR